MIKRITLILSIAVINGLAQTNQSAMQNSKVEQAATKRVLIEEGTGTWCVACPWGIVRLDEMHKKYPSTTAIVSVHIEGVAKDPMQDKMYGPGLSPSLPGVPTALIDRLQKTAVDPDQFEAEYLKRIAYAPAIDVFIDKISFNATTRLLSFNVNAKTVAAFNGTYRFNAAITEMQVHGTTTDYDQSNTYSDGVMGPLTGFDTMPDPVPAARMYYDFVARGILGNWEGTANSIPATNASGQLISYTYTKTIPSEWNEKNLSIIGFVINSADGSVENASLPTKLDAVITDVTKTPKTAFMVYPNPTNGIVTIKGTTAMDVAVVDITGKQILKTMKNATEIDLSELSNGVYFLNLSNGKEVYSKKITLIK